MAKSKGKIPPQLAAHQFTKGSAKAKKAGAKGGKISPKPAADKPTPKVAPAKRTATKRKGKG